MTASSDRLVRSKTDSQGLRFWLGSGNMLSAQDRVMRSLLCGLRALSGDCRHQLGPKLIQKAIHRRRE